MSLIVGDVGTLIDLNITEPNSNNVQVPTEFTVGTDTVSFCFKFSDGTTLLSAGIFVTGSKARYTTVADDIAVAGRAEIQLQIVSPGWSGTSSPFITTIGKKNC
jgi:hypothetical protein